MYAQVDPLQINLLQPTFMRAENYVLKQWWRLQKTWLGSGCIIVLGKFYRKKKQILNSEGIPSIKVVIDV